jgi:hypothetical protein
MTDLSPDKLPPDMADLLASILARQSPELLQALSERLAPSPAERIAIESVLVNEFTKCLDANSEPSDEGKQVDILLGSFLLLLPIYPDDLL